MKKMMLIGVAFVTLLASCNDKLWDEIDVLNDEIALLQEENVRKQKEIDGLVYEIGEIQSTILVNETRTDEAFAQISDVIIKIDDNYNEIISTTDSLTIDIVNLEGSLEALHVSLVNLIQEEITTLRVQINALEEEFGEDLSGLEISLNELALELDRVNETLTDDISDTNVSLSGVYSSLAQVSSNVSYVQQGLVEAQNNIDYLICSANYDEIDGYLIPEFSHRFTSHIIEMSADFSQVIDTLYSDLHFAAYGSFAEGNLLVRAYDEDGWVGTYGLDHMEMRLPGWKDQTEYDYPDGSAPFLPVPGEGFQVFEDEESSFDNYVSFEFDSVTSEYTGCVNDDNAEWYVNGELKATGANPTFEVGKTLGLYVVTIKIGEDAAQHQVDLDGLSGKAGKKRGRVKVRRPI